MRRIIISDLHIGSMFYKEEELISFLKGEEYDQLILAGDIIDFIKIPVFTKRTAELIRSIDYSKSIIYIVGNHDIAMRAFRGEKVNGIEFCEKYEFEEGGRRFRIEHGDRYETGLVHAGFLIKIISVFQDFIERRFKIDLGSWLVNLKIKKRKLRRIWDILKRNDDVDVLVMGHAHCPECIIWVDEHQIIKTYVNSGDWVSHSSYVEVNDGIVRLRRYEENTD